MVLLSPGVIFFDEKQYLIASARSSFTTSQFFLKKSTVNPSGPCAVPSFMLNDEFFISSAFTSFTSRFFFFFCYFVLYYTAKPHPHLIGEYSWFSKQVLVVLYCLLLHLLVLSQLNTLTGGYCRYFVVSMKHDCLSGCK